MSEPTEREVNRSCLGCGGDTTIEASFCSVRGRSLITGGGKGFPARCNEVAVIAGLVLGMNRQGQGK